MGKAIVKISRVSVAGEKDRIDINITTEDGKVMVQASMSFDEFTAALFGERKLVDLTRFSIDSKIPPFAATRLVVKDIGV